MAFFTNRWLISAVVVAVLAGALAVQSARLNAARHAERAVTQIANQWRINFEAMEATNAANVRAIDQLHAEAKRIEAQAHTARQNTARLAAQYDTLRKKLTYAASDKDSPSALSAVLCRTFNELHSLEAQQFKTQSSAACGF